jgi:polyhydroxyalkanoate synthase
MTAANPQQMRRALAGLRAYQEAPREPSLLPMPVLAQREGAMLRDYGGEGPSVLFVPSLINPPTVLDLDGERSLLRWLAARGHRVLLLDWGQPGEGRRSFSIADHIDAILVPLIAGLDSPPALVGYCLGGTMAVAAAALAPVRSVATIAAPWRFAGFPEASRDLLVALWRQASGSVAALGVLPMEVLQSAFWGLDPERTVGKFEAFAKMEAGSREAAAFVSLEDWANDGPPLGEAAARELFEDFLLADLPGSGKWRIGDRRIMPESLTAPLFNIVSMNDRIVPIETAIASGERLALGQGHVGMIVGSHAREALWEPLDAWLSRPSATC